MVPDEFYRPEKYPYLLHTFNNLKRVIFRKFRSNKAILKSDTCEGQQAVCNCQAINRVSQNSVVALCNLVKKSRERFSGLCFEGFFVLSSFL